MPVINADTLPGGNLTGAEHGATVSVILDHSEPGHGPRLHKHPYDETWVMIEGNLTFQAGDAQLNAGPGDIVIVPPRHRTSSPTTGQDAPTSSASTPTPPSKRSGWNERLSTSAQTAPRTPPPGTSLPHDQRADAHPARGPVSHPASRRLMLLHLAGRKTGRRYRQPVSYIRDGDTLLTPGGGRWKFNLIGGQPVPIRLRGRDIKALPEIVSDPDEVQRLLELMASRSPTVKRFVAIPQGPDGHFDRERLQTAIGYGFRIIRWHPNAVAAGDPERAQRPGSTP